MDQIWLKIDQKGLRIGLKELRIVHLDQKLLFLVELGVPLFSPFKEKILQTVFHLLPMGTFQKLRSGFFPLRGGGVGGTPPFR